MLSQLYIYPSFPVGLGVGSEQVGILSERPTDRGTGILRSNPFRRAKDLRFGTMQNAETRVLLERARAWSKSEGGHSRNLGESQSP